MTDEHRHIYLTGPVPKTIKPPFRFRDAGGEFEGTVESVSEFVGSFEPVDVLNGVSELVDAAGNVITIHTDDPRVIEDNEYPKNFEGIYYILKSD